ncbi:neuropeptide receptor 15-like [Tachypleus tridentatus]|uniref:neuropeptide receptor 15-like n=1 Tax=Tachypleus tridentatus TaxID=6853 RepID=UPI003FD210A0
MGFEDSKFEELLPYDLNMTIENETSMAVNITLGDDDDEHLPASKVTIISLSVLFFVIGSVGLVGNFLVIYMILSDTRMRSSMTNLFIMNLAISDFIIMIVCVPDIIQFMENNGWQLGLTSCKVIRFSEVSALYASVMTLVSVCIERYVAIIHPIRAHLLCCRGRIILSITVIWPLAMIFASPNLFFHVLLPVAPGFKPCVVKLSRLHFLVFKYLEFTVFYLVPLIIQIVLYIGIGRRLFRPEMFQSVEPVLRRDNLVVTMNARRGVVKMLIAGVSVYFISLSPHQVLLFYNTFSQTPFQETWTYLIFVNIMVYASSACNPLLYSIFSLKFRGKFRTILFCRKESIREPSRTLTVYGQRKRNFNKSVKTDQTEL